MREISFNGDRFDANITTTENHLLTVLLTRPEIYPNVVTMWSKFMVDYMATQFGKLPRPIEYVTSRKYKWQIEGLPLQMITMVNAPGSTSPTLPDVAAVGSNVGLNFSEFDLYVSQNYFTMNDVLELNDGIQIRVVREPVIISTNYVKLVCRINGNDPTKKLNSTSCVAGAVLSLFAQHVAEGSYGTRPKNSYPEWYTNFTTIGRATSSFTASSAVPVLWVEHNGHKAWILKQDADQLRNMIYKRSMDMIFGRATCDADGNCFDYDDQGREVIAGDGVIEQINQVNRRGYNILTVEYIQRLLGDLSLLQPVSNDNEFYAHTGLGGVEQFSRLMREYMLPASTFILQTNDKQIEVEEQYVAYGFNGQKVRLDRMDCFDNPMRAVSTKINPVTGRSYESSHMLILNHGMNQGKNNIQTISRKVMGEDRYVVSRDINGMSSLGAKSNVASTDFDGMKREYLTEYSVRVLNPLVHAELVQIAV